MAPPLPVYSRDEIKALYPYLFPERTLVSDDTFDTMTPTTSSSTPNDEIPNSNATHSSTIPLTTNETTMNDPVSSSLAPKYKLSLPNCQLYKLTQNQCTYDGSKTICIPFKRLFARCLDTEYHKKNEVVGYKLTPSHSDFKREQGTEVWRNVEITDWFDNDYGAYLKEHSPELADLLKEKDDMKGLLKEFLKADTILEAQMNQYYERLINAKNDEE